MFQKCGTRTRTRLVDIVKVAASVGVDVCRALIGMHAYTGCDSVSALAGKGKASALKLFTIDREIQDTFLQLGQMWDLSRELMDRLEEEEEERFIFPTTTTLVHTLNKFIKLRHSLASSMHQRHHPPRSMISGTTYSVLREVR